MFKVRKHFGFHHTCKPLYMQKLIYKNQQNLGKSALSINACLTYLQHSLKAINQTGNALVGYLSLSSEIVSNLFAEDNATELFKFLCTNNINIVLGLCRDMTEDDVIVISSNDQLTLTSVSKDHEGEWRCQATSSSGSTEAKTILTVTPGKGM